MPIGDWFALRKPAVRLPVTPAQEYRRAVKAEATVKVEPFRHLQDLRHPIAMNLQNK